MPITTAQYQDKILGVLNTIKTDIIAPNSSGSHIETRYIASEGRDDEQWLGYLRDANNVVDIWLLTLNGLRGLSEDAESKGAVGTFSKPVSVVIDYYADYRQGVDVIVNVDPEVAKTNTEHEFLKKVLAVDLAFEKKRGCLEPGIQIVQWDFRLKLRRFATATTHWASGILELRFDDLFLV